MYGIPKAIQAPAARVLGMGPKPRHLLSAGCALVMLACLSSRADELAEKGRAVFTNNRRSIVTVQLLVKSKLAMGAQGARSGEVRQEVSGTIIDPSGLTVASLSATDPNQLLQNVMGGLGDEESKVKIDTEMSEVKLQFPDGTEMPAEVVLRDRVLDLAFFRPKDPPGSPLPAVDLSKPGKAQLLDQVIALHRLGNAAERAIAATVERISAIAERPQPFYVPETSMTTTPLGAPAFALDGKILGFFTMRSVKGAAVAGKPGPVSKGDTVAGIILPAEVVLQAVKQIPAPGQGKPQGEQK